MTQSINLGGNELSAIGTNAHPFSAIFDGKGYCLTNGKFSTSELYGGVFGVLSGTAKNLKVYNIEISLGGHKGYVGGIAGNLSGGSVNTCASIWLTFPNSEMYAAGGIVGMGSGTITSCYNLVGLGDVNSYQIAGGIIGMSGTGTKVEYSYNKGNVYARAAAGGIVGGTLDSITIESCYNLGDVTTSGVNAADSVSSWTKRLPGGKLDNKGKKDGDYCKYDFALLGENAYIESKPDSRSTITIKQVRNGGSAGGILGLSGARTATINNSYNTGCVLGGIEKTYFSITLYVWRSDKTIESKSSNEILIDYDCFAGGLCGEGTTSVSNSYSTKTYSITDFVPRPTIQPRGDIINWTALSTSWNTGFIFVWKHYVSLSCSVMWGTTGKNSRGNWNYEYWGFGINCMVVYKRDTWNDKADTSDVTNNIFAYNLDSKYGLKRMYGGGATQGTSSSKDDLRNRFNSGEWFLPSDVINSGYPALKRFFWESDMASFN